MSESVPPRRIFLTGGTGYLGSRLLSRLAERGHTVYALVRETSLAKLPPDCESVIGDALIMNSYAAHVRECDTFVHLIGVSHPSPFKADDFRRVDLASTRVAVAAAVAAGVRNFVYVSVAHPAPVMQGYWRVRAECEEIIHAGKLNASILRPWYVLGPGHRWPYVLVPLYWIFERLPVTRDTARRLGMVTLDQMVSTLLAAVEHPPDGTRILDAREIRALVDA